MAKDTIITMSLIDKAPFVNIGGEDIVDLSKQIFNTDIQRKIGKKTIVDSSLAGKPHLISKAVYGSQNMIDVLFSYNGYSNPLTIKSGDILYIPDLAQLNRAIVINNNGKQSNLAIKELSKRLSETDKRRINFLKNKENNSGKIKTPNMNESTDQFSIDRQSLIVTLGSEVISNDAISNSINSIINNVRNNIKSINNNNQNLKNNNNGKNIRKNRNF